MSLLSVYLFFAALGGVLLGASLFLGGDGEADLDADADADADLDAGADDAGGFEWSVLPFGSLRFWTFLTGTFGLMGALLELLGVPTLLGLAVAVVTGAAVGWGAFHLFRWLSREEVTGETDLSRYVEHEARVLVPVRRGGLGKIVIDRPVGRLELLATTRDARDLEVGSQVLVVAIGPDGRAEVTSLGPATAKDRVAQRRMEGQPET